jgi:ribonuclease Z
MRPFLHPHLVNGRSGDPAVFVETLFERRAILFDLGDVSRLAPRSIRRLEHVFVSHTHLDHFFGFDRLLRVLVGREKSLNFYGPKDFIDQVHHKLLAYRWNLVDRYVCDLVLVAREIDASLATTAARFRLKNAFAREALGAEPIADGVLLREPTFQVTTAILEHRTPCLGYAIEEAAHVNVWKNRLLEIGLPVGPWLRDLKYAIVSEQPDDYPIGIDSLPTKKVLRELPLGALRQLTTTTPGQKIAYIADTADTPANRAAILTLARDADILFIEATYAAEDAALASERAHLTTVAAGEIAGEVGAHRVEPFHFSHRYKGQEDRLLNEVSAAFARHQSPEAAR